VTADQEAPVPAGTIAGIALASALVPLNSTMIAVALPEIATDFDISKGRASVLVTVYLVAMLLGQPIAGRVADLVGARRLAVISASGFGAFSLAAVAAGSFWVLVAARALQAAFAAGLVPSVQAMLREVLPARERGRGFGVQGSVLGLGAGLGPVIGGLATAALGWRAIFAVNLPVVAVVLHVLLRRIPPPAEEGPVADDDGGLAPSDTGRLLNPVFTASLATQALSTIAQYGLLLAVPIALDHRGWDPASIGVALSLLTAGMVVTGPYGGRLGDAWGRRRPVVAGLAVALVAVCASVVGGDEVASPVLGGTLLLFGIGLGVATPSVMTAGMEAAPQPVVGSAAGLLSASRYVGSITATLVLAGVMQDDGSGLRTLLIASAAGLVVALVAARSLPALARTARPPVDRVVP
jgi:DHA2 family methylenomycin A resistance protein-like MFS transporter